MAVVARNGDPEPVLIQHTIGSREAATNTTGSCTSMAIYGQI